MSKISYYKLKIENLIVIDKIVTIHYFEFTKDFIFAGESHDFWEIVYIDKGSVIVSRDGEHITLNQGDLLFHKPDEYHSIKADGVTAPNVFVMSFVCKSRAMSYFNEKQFKLSERLKVYISTIMREAKQTFNLPTFNPDLKRLEKLKNPNLAGQQIIRINLEQLLIMLMRKSEKENSPAVFISNEMFAGHIEKEILKYLNDNLHGKISLDELCKKLSYGKTFLCTQFKKQTGFTILAYFNNLKNDRAKQLIREKKYSIKEISDLLGYDSPSYFSKSFKRINKMTPIEFLQSIK